MKGITPYTIWYSVTPADQMSDGSQRDKDISTDEIENAQNWTIHKKVPRKYLFCARKNQPRHLKNDKKTSGLKGVRR